MIKHPFGNNGKKLHSDIVNESIKLLKDKNIDPQRKVEVVLNQLIVSVDYENAQVRKNNIPQVLRAERARHKRRA